MTRVAYGLSIGLGVLMAIGWGLAVSGGGPGVPPDWLVQWTDWLVSALGVTAAPLVLITAGKVLLRLVP